MIAHGKKHMPRMLLCHLLNLIQEPQRTLPTVKHITVDIQPIDICVKGNVFQQLMKILGIAMYI